MYKRSTYIHSPPDVLHRRGGGEIVESLRQPELRNAALFF
jgi:hypothetical protein